MPPEGRGGREEGGIVTGIYHPLSLLDRENTPAGSPGISADGKRGASLRGREFSDTDACGRDRGIERRLGAPRLIRGRQRAGARAVSKRGQAVGKATC